MVENAQNLTKTEREVLNLYVVSGLSASDIANRRQTSVQAVYKILKKLHKKGYVEKGLNLGLKKTMPVTIKPQKWHRYFRLHGIHLKITPYYFYPKYSQNIGKLGTPYGKWMVMVNKNNVELQLQPMQSYDSPSLEECKEMLMGDIHKTLFQIENRFGFEAWKNQRASITLVNHHIAEVNNGIARELQGTYMQIIGADSKVWCQIDMSIKRPELEFVHPRQAFDDAGLISAYLNDLRENQPLTNSMLMKCIHQNTLAISVLAEQTRPAQQEKKPKTTEPYQLRLGGFQ